MYYSHSVKYFQISKKCKILSKNIIFHAEIDLRMEDQLRKQTTTTTKQEVNKQTNKYKTSLVSI